MKAVFDTSTLCYLVLIQHIDILPDLFGEILIPEAVADELKHPGAATEITAWARAMPDWIECRAVDLSRVGHLEPLHLGERQAIALAQQVAADVVIFDEKAGREKASQLGLPVMGLLGTLDLAALRGLIDLPTAVARLQGTSFYVSSSLLKRLLDKHRGT